MKHVMMKTLEGSNNKAHIVYEEDGTETLFSYETPIIERKPDGTLNRLWYGWSATTGRHIKAFCGLNKKQFEVLG